MDHVTPENTEPRTDASGEMSRQRIEALMEKIETLNSEDLQVIEDLCDKVDGLESDLADAVEVAISRGAVDWARLNYPDHPSLRTAGPQMTAFAAAGVSALNAVLSDHKLAYIAMSRFLEQGNDPSGAFGDMSVAEINAYRDFHKKSAEHLEELIGHFEPETRAVIEDRMMRKVQEVAEVERKACTLAVGCAWAPVEGTPYTVGPRKFCDAIDRMDPVEITSLPQSLEMF